MSERLKADPPGSIPWLVYRLPLRDGDFLASFTLPRDLTRAELTRITQMLQTLVIPLKEEAK